MIKKIINLIKKNLLFLNVLIILSTSVFYYLNYKNLTLILSIGHTILKVEKVYSYE